MANAKIIFDNKVDTATITASSGNMSADLPVTNVSQEGRTKVARTTDTNSMVIDINFGSTALPIGGAAIVRHNLRDVTGTWRVQLYSGENQTTEIYDSGNVTVLSNSLTASIEGHRYSYDWFTEVNAKSARITLSDSGNTDGYLEVSRVVLGEAITTTYNIIYGAQFGWNTDSRQTRTEGGSLRTDTLADYRVAKFEFKELSEAERSSLSDGMQIVGKDKSYLVSLYPDVGGEIERDNTILVKNKTMSPAQAWIYNTYRQRFDVVES